MVRVFIMGILDTHVMEIDSLPGSGKHAYALASSLANAWI